MFGQKSTRQIDLHLPTGWNRCATEELEAIAAAINQDLRNAMYDAVRCRLGSMYCHQRPSATPAAAAPAATAAQGAQGWTPQDGQPFPAQEETDDLPF